MANRNKAKGSRFELAVLRYLRAGLGDHAALRPRQEGWQDKGDIHVAGAWVLQCKDYASVAEAFRIGLEGAEAQRIHAGLPWGVAVVKYRGKGTKDARVVMTLEQFRDLLAHLTDEE